MRNPNSPWRFLFFPMMLAILAMTIYLIHRRNPQLMAQDSLYEHLKKKRGAEVTFVKPPVSPVAAEAFAPSAILRANLGRSLQWPDSLRPSHRLQRFAEADLKGFDEGQMDLRMDGGGVYLNDRKKVAVLDLEGKQVWHFNAPAEESFAPGAPAIGVDVLVAATETGHVYAFEKTSGRIVWYMASNLKHWRQPLLTQKRLIFFTHDTEKGEERWRLVLTDPASGQTKTSVGPFETPLEGELAFDSAENMAFFATNSQIMAVQLNSGEMAWKINGPAPYKGGVTVAQDRVYAVNEEGVIFAHDGRSGRKIWESALESRFTSQASVLPEGNALYVVDANGYMYAVNLRNGKREWRYNTHQTHRREVMVTRMRGSSFAELKFEPKTRMWTLWAFCSSSRICIFEPHEGQLLHRIELRGRPMSLPYIDKEGEDMWMVVASGAQNGLQIVHFMDTKKAQAIREAQKSSPLAPPGAADTSP